MAFVACSAVTFLGRKPWRGLAPAGGLEATGGVLV